MTNKNGLFFVLDGGEGCGKGTLIKKIKECYGRSVLTVRDPGGSMFSEEIRKSILDSLHAKQADAVTMFCLFWAARADLLKNMIIPALDSGKTVISDRFDTSTFAYQIRAQKNRKLEKIFWDVRDTVLGDYKPDIYVYLDLHPKIGLLRKQHQTDEKKNHFDERDVEFHEDVRAGFMEFFSHKEHGIKSSIINAEKTQEEVWKEFKKVVETLTKK